jgi:hypothetical protein
MLQICHIDSNEQPKNFAFKVLSYYCLKLLVYAAISY